MPLNYIVALLANGIGVDFTGGLLEIGSIWM